MEKQKINQMEDLVDKIGNQSMDDNNQIHLKGEKGLIERTESSKIVITENNKQLLNG